MAVRIRRTVLLLSKAAFILLVTTLLIASSHRLRTPVKAYLWDSVPKSEYNYDQKPLHDATTSTDALEVFSPTTTVSSWRETGPVHGQKEKPTVTTTPSTTTPPGEGRNASQIAALGSKVQDIIEAILDPTETIVPRMYCPPVNATRYGHLKVAKGESQLRYFIALDLRQVVDLLPRLLGSVVEAIRFLGPHHTALSIVEGNSDGDGTREVLTMLQDELDRLGIIYFYRKQDDIDPSSANRIGNLATLRSQALEPLRNSNISDDTSWGVELPGSGLDFSADDTTVIFINDVAICAEDILELAHQRVKQNADMTCAMYAQPKQPSDSAEPSTSSEEILILNRDWSHVGGSEDTGLFYDVWISRTLSGNLFFDIPDDGSWSRAEHLFPFDTEARTRFAYHRPFQVFSCWNGAVAFTAKPILEHKIDFRSPGTTECFQGEPQLFCKDMWFQGYGKIAVVPSVNLEYTDAKGRKTKADVGYASNWTAVEDDEEQPQMMIEWERPPDEVKCMPTFSQQTWRPWNESLVDALEYL